MFVVTPRDISKVLSDFEIMAEIQSASELQRYDYAASSKEVRLILKAEPGQARHWFCALKTRRT